MSTQYQHFIADNISLLNEDCIDQSMVLNSPQLTDIYLPALAVQNHCRLVTLGQSTPVSAVIGASSDHLVVL